MSENIKATIEILEHYHHNGGFYEIPVEVINTVEQELEEQDEEIENLKQEIDKLVDTIEDVNREFSQYKYENKKEIERLNNIIKRYDNFIRRRLELEGYSDTFIKHQMRELKTPDYNDLLNTEE